MLELALTALLILALIPWGPMGVAVAWTLSYWILIVPAFWYAGRPINIEVGSILAAVWKYVAASWLAAAGTALILQRSLHAAPGDFAAALTRLTGTSLLFACLYLAAVIVMHRSAAPLYRFARLFQEMLSDRKSLTSVMQNA
jgi:PST family polysaccharide transporter